MKIAACLGCKGEPVEGYSLCPACMHRADHDAAFRRQVSEARRARTLSPKVTA